MAFTGCSKDSTNPEIEKPGTVTMTVIASDKIENAPLTRTHYDEITQKIQWDGDGSTEFIQFLEQDNAAATPALQAAESTSCTLTAGKASFTVTLKENPSTNLTYAAVYPAGNYVTDNQSLSKVKVNLPATQTPIATSFDPNADLMVARAVQMTSQPKTEPISLSFGRVAALGKMTITNLGLAADETVKSVSFTAAGKVLAGRSYVDIATGRIIEIGYFSPSDRIIMDFSAAGTIAPASFPAWFTCYPCSLAANDSFTLVVTSSANKTYTKQVTLSGAQKLVFTPGDITTFSVNMAGIAGETQASDAKIATLTYEEVKSLNLAYATPVEYTNTGGTWVVQAYKGTNPVGMQLNNNTNAKNSHIQLPVFSKPITSVSVEIAKAGTSLTLYAANDTGSNAYATLSPVVGANTFTVTENFNTAYLKSSGVTVITSVTVTTGATIRIADIKDVAATGVTGASATYEPVSFTGEDDTAVTAFDGTIVTAVSVDNTTKTLTYTVSPNYTGTAREGSITLTSADNDATVTIKVSQKADQFEVSPASITLGGDSGATAEFTLTSDFEVDAPDVSAPDKFSVSGPVDNVYTVTALADGGAAEAELGTITFTRKGDNKEIVIPVSQVAKGGTSVIVGKPYTLQPSSNLKWSAWSTVLSHSNMSWTPLADNVATGANPGNWDGNSRGQQFGSSSKKITSMSMTGTGYATYCSSETACGISSIDVSACAKSGTQITIAVTVGGVAMTSTNATNTISGSTASAVVTSNFTSDACLTGDIVITYTLGTPGALYINTIKIN